MANVVYPYFARIISIVSIVAFAISLCLFSQVSPLSAAAQAVRWNAVSIPAEGEAGGWALADGYDIRYLTGAADGTLYACGAGAAGKLLKSSDGGLKWTSPGGIPNTVTALEVCPDDSNLVYYTTDASVYRSIDGGRHFFPLPAVPGVGAGNREITSLAVGWVNGAVIAVGTRDMDGGQYGGVYFFDETEIIPAWQDTAIGNYDIYAVAFPPDFPAYRQIIAVATDETDSYVFNRIADTDWNIFYGAAKLQDNSGAAITITQQADIAFPGSYSVIDALKRTFYIGVNTGSGDGDVYKITGMDAPDASTVAGLNAGSVTGMTNINITSLAVNDESGSTILLAGTAGGQTLTSADGGTTWLKNKKPPTGDDGARVWFARDFINSRIMYAATGGTGSAFSVSRDMGVTWSQISLIDITIEQLIDIEPSPHYAADNTLFMITYGAGPGTAGLWKTTDEGRTWERIFSGANPGVDVISRIGLPPQYGAGCQTIFVSGESGGSPVIWTSNDGGAIFRVRFTRDPVTGMAFTINSWAIADENTLYIGSNDGTYGMIYRSVNKGFTFNPGAPAGSHTIGSLTLSPDFSNDGTILAGNNDGGAYISSDGGNSFLPLPAATSAAPLFGSINTAFDPDFSNNRHIYASSDTTGAGFYRCTLGEDEEWYSINGSMPAGGAITSMAVAASGVMYGINDSVGSGMERCLNPRAAHPALETVAFGLDAGAALADICLNGSRIWAMDTTGLRPMFFEDTLTDPISPASPEHEISGIGSLIDHTVKNIDIDWEPVSGAASYEWQCAYRGDFSAITAGMQGTVTGSYAPLPPLDPATVYYWRVRVSSPVSSPWSEIRAFTTSLDTQIIELKPESPAAGATGVSVKPVFQWTAVMGASSYELLAAADADFEHPVITKINEYALPSNAWECDVNLEYDTTYYWKVRAISAATHSSWSSAGVFTTLSPPFSIGDDPDNLPEIRMLDTRDPMMNLTPPQITPVYPPASEPESAATPSPAVTVTALADNGFSGIPEWLIYFIGGLLLIVMLALVIVLAVVLKIKRF